jgi:hypothetical protein
MSFVEKSLKLRCWICGRVKNNNEIVRVAKFEKQSEIYPLTSKTTFWTIQCLEHLPVDPTLTDDPDPNENIQGFIKINMCKECGICNNV